MANQNQHSFLQGENAKYLDELYKAYKMDPNSVDEKWRNFFQGYELGSGGLLTTGDQGSATAAHVEAYINAYRRLGHLNANLNPLSSPEKQQHANLNPEAHGLMQLDPNEKFTPSNLSGVDTSTFKEIDSLLKETYCGSIGADFREINDIEIVEWLQNKMESCRNRPEFSQKDKLRISKKLAESEGLEKFLQARFLGQKRFSIEGLESFIPLLDQIIHHGSKNDMKEICVGMAHRGRLNVLANIFCKSKEKMLKEFEDSEFNPDDIDGDVKYHLGFTNEMKTDSGSVLMSLLPNPSHLEAINPVVQGFVRARQAMTGDHHRKFITPVLIHGDAAVVGQGVVAETFNLSGLEAFTTGGTVHVITNNQIGFTTEPTDYRSSHYSSGIAKVVRAPVFHVNADDPEAVVWAATLATEYRQKFGRDIVIDLIGYRRHGHNETDEPGFTQPTMYQVISKHKTVHTKYKNQLVAQSVATEDQLKATDKEIRAAWQNALETIRAGKHKATEDIVPKGFGDTYEYVRVDKPEMFKSVKTGITKKTIEQVGKAITTIPEGFTANKKLVRLIGQREEMIFKTKKVDWPLAELLAFGSLATEGHHVRLSGQDCRRGTFSSRHGVWRDNVNDKRLEPLNQISSKPVSYTHLTLPTIYSV